MSTSIALTNRIEHAHERIDALHKKLEFFDGADTLAGALTRIKALEGEIRMIKARAGKEKTVVD